MVLAGGRVPLQLDELDIMHGHKILQRVEAQVVRADQVRQVVYSLVLPLRPPLIRVFMHGRSHALGGVDDDADHLASAAAQPVIKRRVRGEWQSLRGEYKGCITLPDARHDPLYGD